MRTQNRTTSSRGPRDSSGAILIVGIVALAVGLGVGYYFGKSVSSNELPATSSAPIESSSAALDPAVFRQREAQFKNQLESNPKDLDTLIQLGNLYYDDKKYDSAIIYYGKALDIDPSNVGVRTDRGTSFWNLGKTDEAIAEFQKSLQVDPSHAQTLFNLGIVYLHGKNDAAAARNAWEKLLATNPNYPQRDQLQQMLAAMGGAGQAGSAAPPKSGQSSSGSSASMEDLLRRLKK